MNLTEALKTIQLAKRNGEKVIAIALMVERILESIVVHYLFKNPSPEREFFEAHVVSSDWFSFSSKKRLVVSIVNLGNYMQGPSKAGLERSLKAVMELRNAFAHGDITVDAKGRYVIRYFSGAPKEMELDDSYWTAVERQLHDCIRTLDQLMVSMGMQAETSHSKLLDASEGKIQVPTITDIPPNAPSSPQQ
jgi:hypothetical protein